MTKDIFYNLENPQTFTGEEINSVNKQWKEDTVKICLVFPDKYEIGMSHYGMKLLYHVLDGMENVNVDRCFAPTHRSAEVFKEKRQPLISIDYKIPLNQFHVVGFSLLSEMNFTNILHILQLSEIPLFSKARGNNFPLIIAGGISVINPEPLRDFFDLFGIGDGEKIFPEIIHEISSHIQKGMPSKQLLLEELNELSGIYVPSLSPVKKSGMFYVPEIKSKTIDKVFVDSIHDIPGNTDFIVPFACAVFNRLDVEISRGCLQNCRFCQAKAFYSPYRVKSVDKTLSFIQDGLKNTGFDSLSLLSLSAGDYPHLIPLLHTMPDFVQPGISLSVASLRPVTLSDQMLAAIAQTRKTGITIVPEAGSQRLRRVINKDVSDEEIFQAIEMAIRNKWEKIKLYFMIGLPTETEDDIQAMVELVSVISKKVRPHKIKIHASFSSFVPKPHTPFQWFRRDTLQEIFKKISMIKEGLGRYRNIELDFHNPCRGVVETILARGDVRVGKMILKAFEKGEIFSAWDDDFFYRHWEDLIDSLGLGIFLDEIPLEQKLPWDFLHICFSHKRLKDEYRNAMNGEVTLPCFPENCRLCGGCFPRFPDDHPQKANAEQLDKKIPEKPGDRSYNKIRVFYKKDGNFRFFSQLNMIQFVERLVRKSGMAFKCSEGYHPRMKITTLPPLPVSAVGKFEVMEFYLDEKLKEDEILDRLNRIVPNFSFDGAKICNDIPTLSRDVDRVQLELDVHVDTNKQNQISQLLGDTDKIRFGKNKIYLDIQYGSGGQERYGKIYKIIDPEKKHTSRITRTHVSFKSES